MFLRAAWLVGKVEGRLESLGSSSTSKHGIVLMDEVLPASPLDRRRRLSEVRIVSIINGDYM